MAEYRKGYKVDPRTGLTKPEERAGLTREEAEAQAQGEVQERPPDGRSTSASAEEYVAEGFDGYLRVGPSRLVIEPKGGVKTLVGGGKLLRGTKEIPLAEVTAVQLRGAPGFGFNGNIQISYTGGLDLPGLVSENTVYFSKGQQPAFEKAKELIDEYRHAAARNASAGGDLRDLETLADLRDKGIISVEEFEAKKRQILGL
jgi:Short C-terminal domain